MERRKWVRENYSMQVQYGKSGPQKLTVDGLTDGVFGLDRRRCYDFAEWRWGYVITHLQTGYAVRHLACDLTNAKRAVNLLHAADWQFLLPEEAAKSKERLASVKAVNLLGFAINPSQMDAATPSAEHVAETP